MSTEAVAKTPWWRRGSTLGCLACALPIVAYVAFIGAVFGPSKIRADRENHSRGDTVIAALESYRSANGRYPPELLALQPTHLARVPHPVRNTGEEHWQSFGYALLSSGAAFRLSFREAPMMPLDDAAGLRVWDSRTPGWIEVPPEH